MLDSILRGRCAVRSMPIRGRLRGRTVADEPHVCDDLELQMQPEDLAWCGCLRLHRRAVIATDERQIAAPPAAALRNDHALTG